MEQQIHHAVQTSQCRCVCKDNKERCNTVAIELIMKSFYADNLIKSVITTGEAVGKAVGELGKGNF